MFELRVGRVIAGAILSLVGGVFLVVGKAGANYPYEPHDAAIGIFDYAFPGFILLTGGFACRHRQGSPNLSGTGQPTN